MSGKPCIWPTETSRSGHLLLTQSSGQTTSQFVSAWAVRPTSLLLERTLYYLLISQKLHTYSPPKSALSTTNVIVHQVIALQKQSTDLSHLHLKVFQARLNVAIRFE